MEIFGASLLVEIIVSGWLFSGFINEHKRQLVCDC